MTVPRGLALYVRRIQETKHGSPADFAARCADHGMGWMALAGPWHDLRGGRVRPRFINPPDTCRRYGDALAQAGVTPYIWGYPWQGTEALFAEQMVQCSGDHRLLLLDAELGCNPMRSRAKHHARAADEHARVLVARCLESGATRCGLSSYGVIPAWFPMTAFMTALSECFGGRTFAGGQVYTDDRVIGRSLRAYVRHMHRAGVRLPLIPNFGTYRWTPRTSDPPLSRSHRKAVRKSPRELSDHLSQFVNGREPFEAMIGWAESFVGRDPHLWRALERFARRMR